MAQHTCYAHSGLMAGLLEVQRDASENRLLVESKVSRAIFTWVIGLLVMANLGSFGVLFATMNATRSELEQLKIEVTRLSTVIEERYARDAIGRGGA